MTSRHSTVIFVSPQIGAQTLSRLKSACADSLCLKVGADISAEACDFLCDGSPITQMRIVTNRDTDAVDVVVASAARVKASESLFASLDADQVLLFSHT